MGSMLVSSCRCWVFVSLVHPVMINTPLVCTVCSLFVLVSNTIGGLIVPPYSSAVLLMAGYVLTSVSLDFLQCVVVRAFSIFVVIFSLCFFCMCFEKACLGSKVRSSIFIS